MVSELKPQHGFAHPFLAFMIVATLSIVGIASWRVYSFNEHSRVQAAADAPVSITGPVHGGPILHGIDLGNNKQTPVDLRSTVPDLSEKTIPPNLDPSSTVYKFFETIRSGDPYGTMYYMSTGLVSAVYTQTKTSQPDKMMDSCRSEIHCRTLVATQNTGIQYTQTTYKNRSGQQGVTLSYKLSEANKTAASHYPKNTNISFSLIPYNAKNGSYWAIDNITVGDYSLRQ